jgi:hypothetical protein
VTRGVLREERLVQHGCELSLTAGMPTYAGHKDDPTWWELRLSVVTSANPGQVSTARFGVLRAAAGFLDLNEYDMYTSGQTLGMTYWAWRVSNDVMWQSLSRFRVLRQEQERAEMTGW